MTSFLRRLGFALLAVLGLLLLSFALPIQVWRTGELPAPSLPLIEGGPSVAIPHRVWIDTDAACGQGRTTDPDDCFAILLLARSPDVTIVGISTVHGNAPLAATDSVTRALTAELAAEGRPAPPVFRGRPRRSTGRTGGARRRMPRSGAPPPRAHWRCWPSVHSPMSRPHCVAGRTCSATSSG